MAGSRVNQNCILVRRPSSEFWWLAGKSTTLRLGVERRRQLCAGTETPPSWAISLSEDRDQGDRDCVYGRDLIAGKQYS